MHRLSLKKLRWLFVAFFLALAIPSGILSYKAYEQLRWQALHQYQQDAKALVDQIDQALMEAIDREEARSDTDYTFFVLAGSPEARFIQRSELSKFPVESDISGVIGYFQIDEKGAFSSPILPSSHVQSAVQPQLYGISPQENRQRNQLEQSVWQILSQNKLVESNKKEKPAQIALSEMKEQTDNLADTKDLITDKEHLGKSYQQNAVIQTETSFSESQFSEDFDEESQSGQSIRQQGFTELQEKEQKNQIARLKQQKSISEQAKKSKAKALKHKSALSGSQYQSRAKSRKNRVEKNYSPQQSLTIQEEPSKRVEQDQIQIKLFESEIEPFRFSLLESGHFVVYRQVWRNNKRFIQGAVLSAQGFLDSAIKKFYQQSSVAEIASLKVYYAAELIKSFYGGGVAPDRKIANYQPLQNEVLSVISLSEPFAQFSLDFRVIQMPIGAGASFIKAVAGSLLLILILGTYFLYRLTLKQSNLAQQQQDFVSSVSHELKTPLTSIRMYGEILKQGWVGEEKKEEYYDYIYTESERLSRLIANVLQISKVSHNALDLNLVDVALTELVSLIRSKVDSQIAQSEFSLEVSVDSQIKSSSILVDTDAFVQVIINLVDNSIKYAVNAEKKHIDIEISRAGKNRIEVSVRDFGPGISKSHIKEVFGLFYRSGNELTREVAGTGIGLALVKELVTAMGGKIDARNRQPGAEFILSFSRVG